MVGQRHGIEIKAGCRNGEGQLQGSDPEQDFISRSLKGKGEPKLWRTEGRDFHPWKRQAAGQRRKAKSHG